MCILINKHTFIKKNVILLTKYPKEHFKEKGCPGIEDDCILSKPVGYTRIFEVIEQYLIKFIIPEANNTMYDKICTCEYISNIVIIKVE